MNAQDLLSSMLPAPDTSPGEELPTTISALAWIRVSTDMQEERGASLAQQQREIEEFAIRHNILITQMYSEVGSAYQHNAKRLEFHKMLEHARRDPEIKAILVHDYSRFSRDSIEAQTITRDLRGDGVAVLSVSDPVIDPKEPASVYLEHIIFAKNEVYSREVSRHTKKGCKATVQTRDPETGWYFKNGMQAPFGYMLVRVQRGVDKRGLPIYKSLMLLDETIVNGRPMHEWARESLEMAARGASLQRLCDFCEENGIPGRRKAHWGNSTWHALMQPAVLMKYCGHEAYNVHNKDGSVRPTEEWIIVENAHPPLITADTAQAIINTRSGNGKRSFDRKNPKRNRSQHLLSGGLFTCARCGANMAAVLNGKHAYYKCGATIYRKGRGCGPGLAVGIQDAEGFVTQGLQELLEQCADGTGFARIFNEEIQQAWAEHHGYNPMAARRLQEIDGTIKRIHKMITVSDLTDEDLLTFNTQLRKLRAEKESLLAQPATLKEPPRLDANAAQKLLKHMAMVFQHGDAETKREMLRECVDTVTINHEELRVHVTYRMPATILSATDPGAMAEVLCA